MSGNESHEEPLRARTLEILWHCNDRNEEAEQLGMQAGGNVVEGITSVDYCPHNERIVTTGGDKCVRMWQLKPRAMREWMGNRLHDMTACVVHVCTMRAAWMPVTARWSPQGEMVATAHCDGKLCLWWRDKSSGLYRGKETAEGEECDAAVGSSEVQGANNHNGNSGSGGQLQLEEWKNYKHLAGHMNDVYDIAFSPDSRYLISGAGDGSVVIHDIEGASMPVVQLVDQHRKFCRGVAWDPWSRYLHTFGGGPALQCQEVVLPPPSPPGSKHGGKHKRVHVVHQRKCTGEFLGESCSLSFRRLSWSPDGLFLAAPYGKVPRAKSTNAGDRGKDDGDADDIFNLIDAKRNQAAASAQPPNKVFKTEGSSQASNVATTGDAAQPLQRNEEEETKRVAVEEESKAAVDKINKSKYSATVEDTDDEDEERESMVHCVNVYVRDAPDQLAARLCIKGFSEIRGIIWAPCFLEPLPARTSVPVIDGPSPACASTTKDAEESARAPSSASSPASRQPSQHDSMAKGADEDATGAAVASTTTTSAPAAAPAQPKQLVTAMPPASSEGALGSWGPPDYRMALAVWTTDSVIVYTTDSPHRHSDFSDLHMRSITDVAWSPDASFLLTASMDGYISVIGFGRSLAVAHRLPSFSSRPVSQAIARMLDNFAETGRALEGGRSSRAPTASESPSAEGGGNASGSATTTGGGEPTVKPTVAVVRKKKKPTQSDVGVNELAAMLGDAPVV